MTQPIEQKMSKLHLEGEEDQLMLDAPPLVEEVMTNDPQALEDGLNQGELEHTAYPGSDSFNVTGISTNASSGVSADIAVKGRSFSTKLISGKQRKQQRVRSQQGEINIMSKRLRERQQQKKNIRVVMPPEKRQMIKGTEKALLKLKELLEQQLLRRDQNRND